MYETDTADEKIKKALRGKKLRTLRNRLGLTLEAFGQISGIGESTLRQWEHGRGSGLSVKGANRIIAILKDRAIECELEWLMEDRGNPPVLLSDTAHKFLATTVSANDTDKIKKEIELFSEQYPNSIITQIKDDALIPIFLPNDYIGGIQIPTSAIQNHDGSICIVQTIDKEIFVRKIKLVEAPNIFNLIAINLDSKISNPILTHVNLISIALISRVWRSF